MSTPRIKLESTKIDFDAVLLGHPDPEKSISARICIRRKEVSYDDLLNVQNLILDHPKTREYLNHDQLNDLFGASEEDIEKVASFLAQYELDISKVNTLTRTIEVTGKTVGFEAAFDIQMEIYEIVGRLKFVGYKGVLSIPSDLDGIIVHVKELGYPLKIEKRRPHKYVDKDTKADSIQQTGYSPREIAQAYNFPNRARGKGQTIAIIELGGRYNELDFVKFFKKEKLRKPFIRYIGTSLDSSDELSNAEVTLDTEIIGAILPQARIILYFAHSIIDAMKEIINDREYKPDVVSISWAGNESEYSPFDLNELNNLLHEASLLGITIVAASGDHCAYNNGTEPNIQLPSSNPFVLACGGTILNIAKGKIDTEVAWNEYEGRVGTGGGYSRLFHMPAYQGEAIGKYPYQKYPLRAVPDVSANASMAFGYSSVFEGKDVVIGGTSAATPMWAALIASMNQRLGYRLGFVNKLLYQLAGTPAFNQIIEGNNLLYNAAPFWSPCCGLGSPNGEELLHHIKDIEPKE